MKDVPDALVTTFVKACRRAAEYGLMRCSSGNLSWRLDESRFLVTASGSWMADMAPEQVSVCATADGRLLAGDSPSVEIAFHAGILRARTDVDAVLHFQSPAATTLACARDATAIDYAVIPEIPHYIGPVAAVPFLQPGSRELAAAVIAALMHHDLAVLAHHGQVTVARTPDLAIQKAAFFELACDILLRGGNRVEPLPPGG